MWFKEKISVSDTQKDFDVLYYSETYIEVNTNQLLEKCTLEDRRAQKELYDRYFSYVYAIVRRYMKDTQETEDVCMIVFAKVFQSISGFTYMHEGDFKKWMSRIAVHTCLARIKKRVVFHGIEGDIEDKEDDDDLDFRRHQIREVFRILEGMPEGYRTVFNLHAMEGYTLQEVSEILAMSRNTAKSQWLKSRRYIVDKLSKSEKV